MLQRFLGLFLITILLSMGASCLSQKLPDGQLVAAVSPAVPIASIELPEASEKLFPDDAGLINVKTLYGAKGDGATDDTQAIQKAIQDNVGHSKILYFPNGTYLVSDTLAWRRERTNDEKGGWYSHLTFQGQNRDKTVIQLIDRSAGFGDPENPKAVIFTASQNTFDRAVGNGNQAFRNSIYDLTVNTGKDNPGAIGIDYLANNKGAIRDVIIRSNDLQGKVGLSMTRSGPGPCLIQNVTIEGFNYGVTVDHDEYGITFEHLNLVNQREAGIYNGKNVLFIRDLKSYNSVPSIVSLVPKGFITIIDSKFSHGNPEESAIRYSDSELFARNLTANGYKVAIQNKGRPLEGTTVREFSSRPPISLFGEPRQSLNLAIAEAPRFHDNNLANWANVVKFGATPDDDQDDTSAIQAALDSGKSTIYFPTGIYRISDTLYIRGKVKKIDGMESTFIPVDDNQFTDVDRPKPIFRFETGEADTVILERVNCGNYVTKAPGAVWVEDASQQTLVIRDAIIDPSPLFSYRNLPGAGDLFLENVVAKQLYFDRQTVWARQFNVESDKDKIINRGGKLWILGLKTEGRGTAIQTVNGGQTELLGGFLYPVKPLPESDTAFITQDSTQFLSFVVKAIREPSRNYRVLIREISGGETRELLQEEAEKRDFGSFVTSYHSR